MMTGTDDSPLVEEGGPKANQYRLTIWHKVIRRPRTHTERS